MNETQMTDDLQEREVIQADRDAASMLMVECGMEGDGEPQDVRNGECDQSRIVQAFARHRLAFASPTPEPCQCGLCLECDAASYHRDMALERWKALPEDERNGERPYIQGFNAGWEEAVDQKAGIDLDALAAQFCATPLPDTVCADRCASMQGYPNRMGTNLLTVAEAKQVLAAALASLDAGSASS